MSLPIYLQDYKVESEQGYTWNFISHMVLEKCTRLIRIKYDFKYTEFQKEITFEDKLMGTVQLGSKVYNAKNIMKYKYNKELLEMNLTIFFPLEEKICGKDVSWNIFLNDTVLCSLPVYTTTLTYNTDDTTHSNDWTWENNNLIVTGSNKNYSKYKFTITNVPSSIDTITLDKTNLSKLDKCNNKSPSIVTIIKR